MRRAGIQLFSAHEREDPLRIPLIRCHEPIHLRDGRCISILIVRENALTVHLDAKEAPPRVLCQSTEIVVATLIKEKRRDARRGAIVEQDLTAGLALHHVDDAHYDSRHSGPLHAAPGIEDCSTVHTDVA